MLLRVRLHGIGIVIEIAFLGAGAFGILDWYVFSDGVGVWVWDVMQCGSEGYSLASLSDHDKLFGCQSSLTEPNSSFKCSRLFTHRPT